MASKTLISAICPTFNRPDFLLKAVDLFHRQTWTEAELVVLDDSDKAHQVDLGRFKRVRHIKLPDRTTIGAKHNLGNKLAQGDVLVYWDDDDWFHPRRLVRQLEPIALGEARLVGFKRNLILTTGPGGSFWKARILRVDPKLWIGNGASNLRIPIHDGSAMFSRSLLDLGVEHPDQTMNEKVVFLNGLAGVGIQAKIIPNDDLMVYVRHGKNTWRYNESILHEAVRVPHWFPSVDLDFYRKAVAHVA